MPLLNNYISKEVQPLPLLLLLEINIVGEPKVVTFSLFTFIPTVCSLPQWNIALIAIGASAMPFTLVTAIFIIGIVVHFFHCNSE